MPAGLQLPSWDALYPLVMDWLRAIAIVAGALVLTRIADLSIRGARGRLQSLMHHHPGATTLEMEKRTATITEILRKTVAVTIYVAAAIMALAEIGFHVAPLLAGAGIAGLAIGFGAQNLVRDVISGFFMLLEDQIRIGDVAILNGTTGTVEEINLRTTVLRSNDGTVHVFHNGAINTMSNMTRGYSYSVFNIRVGYKEDTDRVAGVLKEIGAQLALDEPYRASILEPVEVFGIDQFTDAGPVIQARIKTLPMKQWEVGREMNRRIKKKFDELGIQLR